MRVYQVLHWPVIAGFWMLKKCRNNDKSNWHQPIVGEKKKHCEIMLFSLFIDGNTS
jgi:hypothetical protein